MTEEEIERLASLLKKDVGVRFAAERKKAGFKSRESIVPHLSRSEGAIKEIERGANFPSPKMIAEFTVLTRSHPASLLPNYILGEGPSETDIEFDAAVSALRRLNFNDLRTLRICAEALAEHREDDS